MSSLSASLASWMTDSLGGKVIEVSTILGNGAVIMEGPISAGLKGCTPATIGVAYRVRDLSGSTGSSASGDGGIDVISRRIGHGYEDLSLDSMALPAYGTMALASYTIGARVLPISPS